MARRLHGYAARGIGRDRKYVSGQFGWFPITRKSMAAKWVDWFNNRRLLEPIGDTPPAEYEMLCWTGSGRTDTVGLTELGLH